MRPDEHKKKRSAQYNKKHGGNKENQAKGSQQKKGSKAKVDAHNQSACAKSEEKKHKSKEVAARRSLSRSDSSDTDEDVQSVQKTYRRREVVSNWDRYEIRQSEEDLPQKRGEDFTKLLNMGGDAGAQFRFKSEEEWEEPGFEGVESDILAVDLEQLDGSVRCIPLYQRLGVDKELFSVDQIKTMDMEATSHRGLLNLKTTPESSDKQTNISDVINHQNDQVHFTEHLQNRDPAKLKSPGKCLIEKQDLKKTSSDGIFGDNNTSETRTMNNSVSDMPSGGEVDTRTAQADSHSEVSSLENDLNLLLCGDNSESVTEISDSKPDSMLKSETTNKTIPEISSYTAQQVEKNETENLEDWLDDFLDD